MRIVAPSLHICGKRQDSQTQIYSDIDIRVLSAVRVCCYFCRSSLQFCLQQIPWRRQIRFLAVSFPENPRCDFSARFASEISSDSRAVSDFHVFGGCRTRGRVISNVSRSTLLFWPVLCWLVLSPDLNG